VTLALAAWRLGAGLLEPLAPIILRARAARGKEDPARLSERLGRPGRARPKGPLVWLHGVSVGESLSLLPLIEQLRSRRPDLALLVTSGTVTSARVLDRRLPDAVIHQYAPVDGPRATRRFLDHWRPSAAVFVESELWPNLITTAQRRGVRLALLSARMTQKSAERWARQARSARELLLAFDLICPQDLATAGRLAGLGAKLGPLLNLKLAAPAPPVNEVEVMALRALGRPIVLAASTHAGEEALVARAAKPTGALLAIAPRHPDRADAVAAELAAMGLSVARRSRGEAITRRTDAYLVDTLGELGSFYAAATVVVMGGAFAPGVGGHNPLEAARLDAAILTGPHAFNSADVYAAMIAEGAAVAVADEAGLARELRRLLADPETARRMGERALAYAERQGVALALALDHLKPLLPA
jgi:3-deoxy-D-manno-octulosonic-acid transferase